MPFSRILQGTLHATAEPGEPGKVTLAEIEERLRSLGSGAQRSIASSKQNALAAGLLGGAAVIASAYLHGRRRGRRRASVLEIRRV